VNPPFRRPANDFSPYVAPAHRLTLYGPGYYIAFSVSENRRCPLRSKIRRAGFGVRVACTIIQRNPFRIPNFGAEIEIYLKRRQNERNRVFFGPQRVSF